MATALLSLIGSVLDIVDQKIKTKYIDQYISLKQRLYDEENKPDATRDDAVLDNLTFELQQLGIGLSAELGQPVAGVKP